MADPVIVRCLPDLLANSQKTCYIEYEEASGSAWNARDGLPSDMKDNYCVKFNEPLGLESCQARDSFSNRLGSFVLPRPRLP